MQILSKLRQYAWSVKSSFQGKLSPICNVMIYLHSWTYNCSRIFYDIFFFNLKYPGLYERNFSHKLWRSLRTVAASECGMSSAPAIATTIIKCGTWRPIKFQLLSHSWNEMTFYRISELLLPISIQRYDKNHLIFHQVDKRETYRNFTDCQMPHFMIELILYKISDKKCLFLRNMEPLRCSVIQLWMNVCLNVFKSRHE